jgi:hypothetical protein
MKPQVLDRMTTMTPDTPHVGSRSPAHKLLCNIHFSCQGSKRCQKWPFGAGFRHDTPDTPDNQNPENGKDLHPSRGSFTESLAQRA